MLMKLFQFRSVAQLCPTLCDPMDCSTPDFPVHYQFPELTKNFIKHYYCSVTRSCPTLCDPMDCSMPGLPVPHHLPKFAQVHVHCFSDAIQPSHPLTPSSSSALNLSQHQGLFQLVVCSHQMSKILELQI